MRVSSCFPTEPASYLRRQIARCYGNTIPFVHLDVFIASDGFTLDRHFSNTIAGKLEKHGGSDRLLLRHPVPSTSPKYRQLGKLEN